VYNKINSTKSPASGASNVSDPRLMLQVERVHMCVSAERWRCQYLSPYVVAAVT
jgi:hypothetical protein